jgi:hypothetical protein
LGVITKFSIGENKVKVNRQKKIPSPCEKQDIPVENYSRKTAVTY